MFKSIVNSMEPVGQQILIVIMQKQHISITLRAL